MEQTSLHVQMIDTAIVYQTEEGVGLGVKRAMDEGLVTREDLFVMTKLPPYDQSVDKVCIDCRDYFGIKSMTNSEYCRRSR